MKIREGCLHAQKNHPMEDWFGPFGVYATICASARRRNHVRLAWSSLPSWDELRAVGGAPGLPVSAASPSLYRRLLGSPVSRLHSPTIVDGIPLEGCFNSCDMLYTESRISACERLLSGAKA